MIVLLMTCLAHEREIPHPSGIGMKASQPKLIYNIIHIYNMDKVKVQLDKDIVNKLIKLKQVGDTYSDVIRRLLK